MDTQLTSDERLMVEAIEQLAAERIAPRAAAIDRANEYPWDIKELLAEQGVLMMPFPVDYGGVAASELALTYAIEAIARASMTSSLILAMQQLGALPILLGGSAEQKRRYLPKLASGEWLVAYGLTEPGAGSDVGAIRTRAERHGDHYVLNGGKQFITNAGLARVNVIFAITDPERGVDGGMSAFIVESDMPGFRAGKIEDTMGIRGSQNGELLLEDCAVPVENRIGQEGDGHQLILATFDRARVGIGAQAVGVAQGAFDYALQYARQRVQFGRPIAEHEGVQFLIADLATEIDAARLLVRRAATLLDTGAPAAEITRATSMAKLFASNMAMRVTTEAVQLLGGYGYTREYPVERMMRDAKITQIYEGTTQMQRLAIARAILSTLAA
ncbi:MAG TPA: acyl-CoA dehydrogenase family protein [Ktedonobacterales bacterium]|nr:acyl-CoA dehydrogenase family protein [Ktedonobacterales bacterium]